jgi:beta-1,4-mannosyltransferase
MVRVLSIPGRSHENRYFALLANAMEQSGCEIIMPEPLRLLQFDYDVLHLNFPTHYISENNTVLAWCYSALLGGYLILARLLGRKIAYTVHDVVPFRSRHVLLSKRFLQLTHRLTELFIFLSTSSREAFVDHYPADVGKPWILALHGPYPVTKLTVVERAQGRRKILGDNEAFLVGFLGSIKPYKNIGAVLALPANVVDGRAVRVVVAGRAEAGTEADVAAVLDAMPPGQLIRIVDPLSDRDLDGLMQCVDVVLLPYVKGTNSGVALLVLSNGARLIGSDLAIFQELARTVGPPWVHSVGTGGILTLPDAIEAVAGQPITAADQAFLEGYLEQISFAAAAEIITTAFTRLLNRPPVNI